MKEFNKTFGVVCNDAGASNQIFALLKAWNINPNYINVSGPAINIANDYYPNMLNKSFDQWMCKVETSGTGWSSDIEHNAQIFAFNNKIRSIALLDHWINYRERFNRNGKSIYPDEIWVVDKYAKKIAQSLFTDIKIVLQNDCYAENIISGILPLSKLLLKCSIFT